MRPARKAATASSFAAFSTAGAASAPASARQARPEAGEALRVGRLEVEAAHGREVEPRARERQPLRPGQRAGDRHAHVGQAELREHRAVDQLDQRVHDRLRMHHHVHALGRDVEEPARLDHLERLVRERGRVDRDLRAHRPVRMRAAPRRRVARAIFSAGQRAERAARRREHEPRHVLAAAAGERLEDRAVLAVDRQQRDAAARAPRAAPARPPSPALPCWRARRRGPARIAASVGARPTAPTSPATTRSAGCSATATRPAGPTPSSGVSRAEALAQLARGRGVGHRHALGPERAHLLGELRDVAARRERRHAEALGELRRDGERLLADAARAAEQREPLHRAPPPLRTCALVRPKRRSRPRVVGERGLELRACRSRARARPRARARRRRSARAGSSRCAARRRCGSGGPRRAARARRGRRRRSSRRGSRGRSGPSSWSRSSRRAASTISPRPP